MADQLDRLKVALSDRYGIERELGSGGMATVYLAEDLKHHRHVAVKVLRPDLAAALGVDRFLREIEITANLNHPHILPLHDSGQADGFLYYVMPFVEGESLRDRLDHEKQLAIDEALKIANEVADALRFAHEHNVIHRDIKPENILLEANHAVVADFGVARALEQAGETRLTDAGIAIGTPAYMSPEQAGGEKGLDGRSDLYSLGCVLYEMLAGEPPFTGPTAESVVRQHLSADPPNVAVIRPTVPPWVAAALERSLAKVPADRFERVESFTEALTPNGDRTPAARAIVKPSRKVPIGVATTVILAVTAAALLLSRSSTTAFDPNRVLVVAFADQSGLEGSQALGVMAQDHIINALTEARFAEVVDVLTAAVASQQVTTAGMGGGPENILALAGETRAGTVVSGRYYTVGDSVQIQTQISDARDGEIVRTVLVVGSLGGFTELVTRLGREVVAAVAPLLDQDLGSWEPAVRPATYEAYEAYSRGVEASMRNDAVEAGRHFERATALDPGFTRAALWAAHSYQLAAIYLADSSYNAKAEALVAPLLEAREQLTPYEHCRLDFVMALGPRLDLSAGYDAAHCLAQEAPGSDDAMRELTFFAWRYNRPGEVIGLLRELDPDRGMMKHCQCYWPLLTFAYHTLEDYERELEVAREAQQQSGEGPGIEVPALAALGRLDEIAANLETVRALPPRSHLFRVHGQVWGMRAQEDWQSLGGYLGYVGLVLRTHGYRDAAAEVFDEAITWFQARQQDLEEPRAQLAWLQYQAERWDHAQQLYEELAQEYPENTMYLTALGKLAARRADRNEALRISVVLRSLRRPLLDNVHTLERAKIAALLGDRREAISLLQQAIDQGVNWGYGVWVHRDIDFESLHDYPPFRELMRPKG